jgi:hypothetical protein
VVNLKGRSSHETELDAKNPVLLSLPPVFSNLTGSALTSPGALCSRRLANAVLKLGESPSKKPLNAAGNQPVWLSGRK